MHPFDATSGLILSVCFLVEDTSVNPDTRELAQILETRCRLEVDLNKRFERRLVTTDEGTLGGAWEGALLFLFTHLNEVDAFCRALHATALQLMGRKNFQFSVALTLADGSRVEFKSKNANLKDVDG